MTSSLPCRVSGRVIFLEVIDINVKFLLSVVSCLLFAALLVGAAVLLPFPAAAADPTIHAQTITIYADAILYDDDDNKLINAAIPPQVQIDIHLPDIYGGTGQDTEPFDYSVDFIFPPAWLVAGQYWTITQDENVLKADTFYIWQGSTQIYYGSLNKVFYDPAWGSFRTYNGKLQINVGDRCTGWTASGSENDDCILAQVAIAIAEGSDRDEYQMHMNTHLVSSADEQIWMYIQGDYNSPEISKGNAAVSGAVSAADGVAGDLAAGASQMRGATAAAKPYIDGAMQLIRNVAANFADTFGGEWINTLLAPIGGILILVFGVLIFTKIFRKAGD